MEFFKIRKIEEKEIDFFAKFAAENFADDAFYAELAPDRAGRIAKLFETFKESIQICRERGFAYAGIADGTLASMILAFDYHRIKDNYPDDYNHIFGSGDEKMRAKLAEETAVMAPHLSDSFEYLYLLAVAVAPEFRRQGIATRLIESLSDAYPYYNLFADVSNADSLGLYRKGGFEFLECVGGCQTVRRKSRQGQLAFERKEDNVLLGIPSSKCAGDPHRIWAFSRENEPDGKDWEFVGKIFAENFGGHEALPVFVSRPGKAAEVSVWRVTFQQLLKFQRKIQLHDFAEIKLPFGGKDSRETVLVYLQYDDGKTETERDYRTEEYASKCVEWDVVPDVYTSIPIRYESLKALIGKEKGHEREQPFNPLFNRILTALRYRTNCEAGEPIEPDADRKRRRDFKERLERFYLGEIEIQLREETELRFDGSGGNSKIGAPIRCGLVAAVDVSSQIGVLHIVSLSDGLLLTQYLDSVSRNQINVVKNDASGGRVCQNLYAYLRETFQIRKVGSAKNFVTVMEDRKQIPDNLIASILFCETLYCEGESIGRVADQELQKILENPNGMAQYDYACVYAYSNVLVQFSDQLKSDLYERIVKESITLFYIELVVLEEAAIGFANEKIIDFLGEVNSKSPNNTLKNYGRLLNEYAETIVFWDLQMNYPSSKKSLDNIRQAFRIEKLLKRYERNQSTFKQIYESKSDFIDKMESTLLTAAGAILTVISIINLVVDPGKHWLLAAASLVVAVLLFLKSKILHRSLRGKKKKNK